MRHLPGCDFWRGLKCECECAKPAPSPRPAKPSRELIEAIRQAMFELPLCMSAADCKYLIRVFAAQGLTIVGPAERAVLDACANLDRERLRGTQARGEEAYAPDEIALANAELTRRNAK